MQKCATQTLLKISGNIQSSIMMTLLERHNEGQLHRRQFSNVIKMDFPIELDEKKKEPSMSSKKPIENTLVLICYNMFSNSDVCFTFHFFDA